MRGGKDAYGCPPPTSLDISFSLSCPTTRAPWWSGAALWDQHLLHTWGQHGSGALCPDTLLSWASFPHPLCQSFNSGERKVLTPSSGSHMQLTLPLLSSLVRFSPEKQASSSVVSLNLLFDVLCSFLQVLDSYRLYFPKWSQWSVSCHMLVSHGLFPCPHQEVQSNSPLLILGP